jgi:N-acetylmuramoyl-L-alanine amidase
MFYFACLTTIQAQKTFCIVLDPGHGGKDPGCVGSFAKEKTINLAVALKVGEMIERAHKDVHVVFTRKTDVFIPLDKRANIANQLKANLFVSIHTNSAKRRNAFGTETYTLGLGNSGENLDVAMRENSVILMEDDYMQKYEGFDPTSSESYIIFEFMQNKHLEQSVFLASEVQKYFVTSERHNRGVRQAGLLVLRKTSMPAVLIELGFISNKAEERFLASDEGQEILAKSIYDAFNVFKSDYDRKMGSISEKLVYQPSDTADTSSEQSRQIAQTPQPTKPSSQASRTETPASASTSTKSNDSIVYKVQILTSDSKLSPKDKRLKGYKDVDYYKDNGLYKYTYGETSDYKTIIQIHKKIRNDFKGAFIIRMKDGKRITN